MITVSRVTLCMFKMMGADTLCYRSKGCPCRQGASSKWLVQVSIFGHEQYAAYLGKGALISTSCCNRSVLTRLDAQHGLRLDAQI